MRRYAIGALLWCVALPVFSAENDCGTPLPDTRRTVVAGGSVTEIIYDLEMQALLVGVDRTSNYPTEATKLPSIGYVRAVSAEGLLSLNPTAIIGEHDIGPVEVVQQVRRAGLPVVRVPEAHTAQGILAKVDCVATLINAPATKVDALKQRLLSEVKRLPAADVVDRESAPRVAILLSLNGGVPTGGGRETSAHGVLVMAGAENVLDDFSGWKPVSLEALANSDPQVIVMPNRGLVAAGGVEAVIEHPSVALTQAGRAGRIIGVDGMSLLGFGPRTLEIAADLADEFAKLTVSASSGQ